MAEQPIRPIVTADNTVPLDRYHDRESFDCGGPPLNDFFVKRALNSMLGTTFVLVSELGSQEIIAYFTTFPSIRRQDSGNPDLTAVVRLEYLGVDRKYQHLGLGSDLLA